MKEKEIGLFLNASHECIPKYVVSGLPSSQE